MVKTAFSTGEISRAANTLKRLRPAYQALLSFYEKVFIAQEDSKTTVDLDPPEISQPMLAAKNREALPLVDISEFNLDLAAGIGLAKALLEIIKTHNPVMADGAADIDAALTAETLSFETLFTRLLAADDAFFEQHARSLQIDKNLLAFMAYHSIVPSLTLCAQQLSQYLTGQPEWLKGYCPICGSHPGLGVLDPEGRRFLYCSFCRHGWATRRVFCPFCENTEAESLLYLFSEQEKDLRADTCQRCKKYIKTVDSRETERTVFPPLEQVASLHLDINAQEQGYTSGTETTLHI